MPSLVFWFTSTPFLLQKHKPGCKVNVFLQWCKSMNYNELLYATVQRILIIIDNENAPVTFTDPEVVWLS